MTGAREQDPIRIGISSCLLGNAVRYDGGHRHDRYITGTLGRFFEFVPFCPEVAVGLGTPRPPIRLVEDGGEIRVRGIEDHSLDVTRKLVRYGHGLRKQLHPLSGYIFKSRSPSCGMERVRVYGRKGHPVTTGAGMFAQTVMQDFPELPVEEEGRLMDPVLRENFVGRVFVYHRWQQQCGRRLTAGRLVDFHTRHKFIVLAHDETAYRELGRLVARAGRGGLRELGDTYVSRLMGALKKKATPRRHGNVLMHIAGFLKKRIGAADREELLEVIDAYRREQVPLIVPLTLLRHHLRHHPDPYLADQYYLDPHPRELMLLNRI